MLIVLSGLPGVGKTNLAVALATRLRAVHLRVDSIEQALRRSRIGGQPVEDAGYVVGHAVARDNLALGLGVIADCVNPWMLTRDAWRAVGEQAGVRTLEVEVICSDQAEHRRRVESRVADLEGHRLPNWADVVARDYRPWECGHFTVDTAIHGVEHCVHAIERAVQEIGE